MNKLKYLLILFLMFICLNDVFAFDVNKKIYDYAQVLTNKQEAKLKRKLNTFIANRNLDIVLVTTKQHEKESTLEYANKFYTANGFHNDGIICVIDFTFESMNIEISKFGNAKDLYSDDDIKKILNDINKKEDKGYYKVFDSFIDRSSYYAKVNSNSGNFIFSYKFIRILKLIVVSFILSSIYILYLFIKSKYRSKNRNIKSYLVKDSFIINKKVEKFITTETKTKR